MKTATIRELFDLGLHFGHQKSHSHPKTKPFIFTVSNGVCVIDLDKTQEKLKQAADFVKKLAKEGKTILFIGTKKQASSFIKEQAEKLNVPYIDKRFMGGTLTNFETVSKNIEKLKDLEEKEKEEKNKKEHRKIVKEKERLQALLGGLSSLKKLPDALFIIDVVKEKNAVSEANRLEIPIVAMVDTNGDPSKIDFPIPANDDSQKGVEYIISQISEAISEGKKKEKSDKS